MNKKLIQKTLTRQHDQQDCGVACLLSIVRYYGGESSFERIRELSGTSKQGTTLLGLYQAAAALGFSAQGCEADIVSLVEHGQPVILHILGDGEVEHYVVCYGYSNNCFTIGNPVGGIEQWPPDRLEAKWKSHACLTLEPTVSFERKDTIKQLKREWIKKLVKDDIGILSASILLGLLIAALGMVMAVFSQKLIDNILPSNDYTKLITAVVLIALLIFIRIGLSTMRQHLLLRQSKDFNNRIVGNFYSRLLFLPKAFFDHRKVGDMTARLNDTRRIQTVISQVLGDTAINILSVVVSFMVLFIYSWQLTIPVACLLPVIFWLVYRYNKPIISQQREVMAAYAQSESNFISTIQGVVTIKHFNKQSAFSELNRYIYGIFQDKIVGLGKINISLGWKLGALSALVTLVVLALGSFFVFNHSLTLGRLMAVLSISGSILPAIASIAMVSIPLNEAKVAFDRMFEFLGIKAEESQDKCDNKERAELVFQSLKIENLGFRFPGRKQLLTDINLAVNKNEIISIAGESGCGKSTFCQILAKFYDFEQGAIVLNSEISIRNIPTEQWRAMLGVVSQDVFIFNGTVLANICFEVSDNEMLKCIDYCKKYGFDKFINELPQGYATIIGEEGINLSGGQKQIIALARALYKAPQLLILDEATASMHKKMEQFTLNLLQQIKPQTTTIFISHRLHILRAISDRIYLFENGTIGCFGTHDELMAFDNLYRDYWTGISL